MAENDQAIRKSKVFISYSRKDKAFVGKLNAALDVLDIDAWVDWEGIEVASDWMTKIHEAIESSDALLFVISPESLKSKVCQQELELGIQLNKKLIPILYRDPEKRQKKHPKLASTNWVYMRTRKDDFKATLPKLVNAIQTDLGWVQQHTRLLQRAVEWDQKKRNNSYLLQGSDLEDGERWMTESTASDGRDVVPLQAEYISTSRKVAVQRQRNLTVTIALVMIASVIMGIFALVQWNSAAKNEQLAKNSAATAVANENYAATQQAIAQENAQLALRNENEAKAQRSAAQAAIYEERPGELDTSTLLALDSWIRFPSDDAEDVLRHNLSILPIPIAQVKHTGRIWNIHLSQDGQFIVSSSADKTACIWTMQGEQKFCVLHDSDVTDAMLTSDNSVLITSSLDGSIRLWDGQNGSPLEMFQYSSGILDFDISPDEKLLTAGREDGFLSVINLLTRKDVFIINFASGAVTTVNFQPSGQWLAVGTRDGDTRVWRVMTGQSLIGPNHDEEIFNLAFSADGKWFVTVGADSTARIVRTESGGQYRVVKHDDWVEDVAFGPDSSWFATASDDNLVRVIETQTGLEKLRMEHGSYVQRVEVSPNGNWILSTGYDRTARLWDSQTGALMFEASIDGIGSSIVFSPDGNQIVVGDRDGNITIWDISTLNARVGYINFPEFINKAKFDPAGAWILINTDDKNLWQIPSSQITSINDGTLGIKVLSFKELTSQLKVSPDSKWIAISENSETSGSRAILYNLETQVLHSLPHTSDISGLAISTDGKLLATTNEGNTNVYIWDIESGQQTGIISFDEVVFTSSYSPKDSILAIGFVDKTILWNTSTNQEISTLRQVGNIKSITFSKEGDWLATTSSDGSIYVWDMNNSDFTQPRYKFLQGGSVTSLDFNTEKQWLASAGTNGFVYLWDLETGEEVARIPHADSVSGINFSPDGIQLSTVSRKTVQIWNIDMLVPITKEALVETACSRLIRNLSTSQWEFFFHEEEYRILCPNLK